MQGPSFEQTLIPVTQVPNLNEICPVVLEKKIRKVNDNHDDYNDDNGQRTNCDHKRSVEPSAQVK